MVVQTWLAAHQSTRATRYRRCVTRGASHGYRDGMEPQRAVASWPTLGTRGVVAPSRAEAGAPTLGADEPNNSGP